MGLLYRLTRSRHIHGDIADRFRKYTSSGRILDLPAGNGVNSRSLVAGGYNVVAGDLFPERCEGAGYEVDKVDLLKPLPYADDSFDGILHSEGIEHLDSQVAALKEMARVLKPGGVLIVTTPNVLHLEGRLCAMLTGHARRNRAIVVSAAQYWGDSRKPVSQNEDQEIYFGHAFLINAFQLRFYLEHVGLEVVDVDATRYSLNSVLLAPLMYPPVWMASTLLLRKRKSRLSKHMQRSYRKQILGSPVLFGRKLIMTARKPDTAHGTPG